MHSLEPDTDIFILKAYSQPFLKHVCADLMSDNKNSEYAQEIPQSQTADKPIAS